MKKSWEEMYAYAKAYYEKNGNLEIPSKFKTNNGYEYEENGKINLGLWISNQRRNTSSKSEKGQLLFQIGMRFENKNLTWEEMYAYAKLYYEAHENLEIPRRFKTNNGYEYDENGKINLGMWIATQRCKTLPESERGHLLSQIGMRFENIISTLSWEEMYEYAKEYYEKNGNLEMPRRFKTNNGYEYDENGKINLGTWITAQRRKTLPESERGQFLSMIGMIWDVKQNKEKIRSICIQNNIDYNIYNINKNILSHITIKEFQSKISYLEENNISLVDANGKLHEIFSMSSLNMKVNYGITLEELINKYYINNVSKKKIKRHI